jgi:hypothetical protein
MPNLSQRGGRELHEGCELRGGVCDCGPRPCYMDGWRWDPDRGFYYRKEAPPEPPVGANGQPTLRGRTNP